MKLNERVVWVTGASSGIGEALVPELVARGAKVVVSARRAEKLEALVAQHGTERVASLPVDLADPAALESAAARAGDAFGPIDGLVLNAGRSQRARALETEMEDVRALMELNVMAPIALTRAIAPGMVTRGRGHLTIVSSVAGYIATPLRSSYSASKYAVRGYFDSLRAELHDTGVEVLVCCPGYVRTEIGQRAVAAGGGTHGKQDAALENGLDPRDFSAKLARAIERGVAEVHIGGPELAGIHLNRLVPSLVRRLAPRLAPE